MADDIFRAVVRKLRSLTTEIWPQLAEDSTSCRYVSVSDIAVASLAGGIAFPLSLGSLQAVVFGPLHLTSNRLLLAPLCGFFSIFLCGSAASAVFASSVVIFGGIEDFPQIKSETGALTTSKSFPFRFGVVDIPLSGLLTLVAFKLLGGRFRSMLPSSLAHPGAFARFSIPASSQNYASKTVKHKLTKIGKKYGCHSCGGRWRTAFVGDHMPPNKLVKLSQEQRFYPQCARCSIKQGTALSMMSKGHFVKTHGTSLRLYHLWIPVPILLMLIREYGPNLHNTEADTSAEHNTTDESSFIRDKSRLMKVRGSNDDD